MIFSNKTLWLDEIDSTNNEAERNVSSAPEGSVWCALRQTKGRGQQHNAWESEDGKNLTFSALLRPIFLKAEDQFLLSKIVSLAVSDFLRKHGLPATIKWPNDIYIGDKKIAGILIENHIAGENIYATIVGIGLNINQSIFLSDAPNPTSFFLETQQSLLLEVALQGVLKQINNRYTALKKGITEKIDTDYLSRMYRFNEWHKFQREGLIFSAKIKGIRNTGELILEKENGKYFSAVFKEISFCL